MVAAEKQYQHRTGYGQYEREYKHPIVKPKPVKKQKLQPGVSPKEKMMMLVLTVLVGMVCVGVIASTAYAATIKYQINTTIKESELLKGEIENLNVQIKSQTNIRIVEEKAKTELGMVYATPEQYVYLDQPKEIQDFAIVLKAQAYNK